MDEHDKKLMSELVFTMMDISTSLEGIKADLDNIREIANKERIANNLNDIAWNTKGL